MAGQLVVVFRFFDVVRAALLCLLPCSVCSFVRVSELAVWPGPATSEGFEEREMLCRFDIQNIV